MLDWIGVRLSSEGTSRLRTLEGNIDFPIAELPAGTVEVASGIVYRQEFFETFPDPVLTAADSVGAANFGPTDGERSVWEVYAEAYVPLLRDQPRVRSLDLHLAGRVSQYSDFGRTTNPRIALRYEPLAGLTFRTSYAHGFRAPTLRQLFGSEHQSFEQLNDPCSLAANVATMPGCMQPSDPTLVQFLTTKGGDTTLRAERSRTFGLGVVWALPFANDLQVSADFFHIKQENVVDASAQYIVNENAESLRFPLRVERDALGNITRVRATLQNIGERDVSGVDLALDWRIGASRFGTWTAAVKATHIAQFEDRFDPGSKKRDQAGTFSDEASGGNGALPDWKANLGLHWHRGNWQAQYNIYYVSAVDEVVPIIERWRSMAAWHTHNLQVGYYGPLTQWFKVSAGVSNLFDREPPFSAAAFNDSYDGRTYDLTGRYLYLFVEKTI
jgi:iron complex outermembrane receptor protein